MPKPRRPATLAVLSLCAALLAGYGRAAGPYLPAPGRVSASVDSTDRISPSSAAVPGAASLKSR